VTDTGKHVFGRVQFLVGGDERGSAGHHVGCFGPGFKNLDRQRLNPFLAGDRGQRLLLGLEREIEIFEALGRVGVLNLLGQLGRELALGFDRFQNRRLTLGELTNLADAKLNLANLLFVEAPNLIFAVARDEGNRVAFVEQLERASHPLLRQTEIARDVSQVDRRGWRHAIKANPRT